MEQIIWTEEFSVGVSKLDQQHKRLVAMINRLITESQVTTGSETISDLLANMTEYAQEHFKTEEELMRQYNYPHLEAHLANHLAFREKTVYFCTATIIGVETVPTTLLHYLCDWLKEHILKNDMAFKPFFLERGLN